MADTGNEVDLAAWLCTIPGIPADWPSAQPIGSGNGLALAQLHGGMPLTNPFSHGGHYGEPTV